MARAALSASRLLAAATLVCAACGEPTVSDSGANVAPISGAAMDAVQRNLHEILDREFTGLRAERVRVEKSADGRRVVVHASLEAELAEAEYRRICRAFAEAAASELVAGQALEAHLMAGDAVVHSCGL